MNPHSLDRLDSFQVDFFGTRGFSNLKRSPLFLTVPRKVGSQLWSFLNIWEILRLSATSKTVAGFIISKELIDEILRRQPTLGFIGRFGLSFGSDVSFGVFRRIMSRIMTGTQGVISIDVQSGRINMDIGPAFTELDVLLPSALPYDDDDSSVPDVGIQKNLEIASYDEYDDFAPRHPLPREKTGHRRGDSFFNSDVEYAANEALALVSAAPLDATGFEGMDLASLAEQAIALELKASPAPAHRRLPNELQRYAVDALEHEEGSARK